MLDDELLDSAALDDELLVSARQSRMAAFTVSASVSHMLSFSRMGVIFAFRT